VAKKTPNGAVSPSRVRERTAVGGGKIFFLQLANIFIIFADGNINKTI